MKYTRTTLASLICLFLITVLGCTRETETENSELVGVWERTFERNGSTGTQYLEITSNNEMGFYEIGDYLIMNEWYSGLPDGVIYRFWSDPLQPITEITENTITVSEVTGTANIINNDTGTTVTTWTITAAGATYQYQLAGDTLTLSIGAVSIVFTKS